MFFRRNDTVSRQIQRRVVILGLASFLGFTLALVLSIRFNLQQLEGELNDSAREAARSIDQVLGEVQRDVTTTAASLSTIGAGEDAVREVLRQALERQETTSTYLVLAPDGTVLEQRRRIYQVPRERVEEQPWLRELSRGRAYMGPVEIRDELPFMLMAAPMTGRQGEFKASLVAEVDLTSLWHNITSRRVGESGQVMITSEDGHILVHRDLNKVRNRATLPQLVGWNPGALSRRGSAFYQDEDGDPSVAAAVRLQFAPWYAVVEQPRGEALTPLLVQGALLSAPILLLALVVLGIFNFTRQRIVLPMMRLRRGVESLSQGRLEHRIEVTSRDELGALAGAFNQLAAQLRATIDRLHHRVEELKVTQRALSEARDTLERRVHERTADLEAANEEMRSVVYLVSHDLRAPLINLKGFTGELRHDTEELRNLLNGAVAGMEEDSQRAARSLLEEEIPESLDFIDTAASRMDSVTIALLKLSRAGHRELTPSRVDTRKVVRDLVASLSFQIQRRGAQVEVTTLPEVVADQLALEQIFGNLLSNAVQYLRDDLPGAVRGTGERKERETVFRIKDNGRGIAEENLGRVFEPFRRIDREGAPGEGMGLAYTQALVRRHRGRIWCTSELGRGSEFLFTIPHSFGNLQEA